VTTGFGVESEAENPKRSVCEPFCEAIELGLSRGRDSPQSGKTWYGRAGSAMAIRRSSATLRKLRGKGPLQARAVILTGPGEESKNPKWMDYGTGAMVRDPQTRKYRRTRLQTLREAGKPRSRHFLRSGLRGTIAKFQPFSAILKAIQGESLCAADFMAEREGFDYRHFKQVMVVPTHSDNTLCL